MRALDYNKPLPSASHTHTHRRARTLCSQSSLQKNITSRGILVLHSIPTPPFLVSGTPGGLGGFTGRAQGQRSGFLGHAQSLGNSSMAKLDFVIETGSLLLRWDHLLGGLGGDCIDILLPACLSYYIWHGGGGLEHNNRIAGRYRQIPLWSKLSTFKPSFVRGRALEPHKTSLSKPRQTVEGLIWA